MEELLKYKFKQRYVVFDTETEGLNLITSKPWQIAWIECEGKKVVKKHNRFIKWDDLNVSPEAARVTGFDRDYYESVAEDPVIVWEDFEKSIYNDDNIIVGQNILGYDIYILNVWLRNIGKRICHENYIDRCFDTKAVAMAIAKNNKNPDKQDILAWQLRYLNYRERGLKTNQKYLLEHYGIDFDSNKLHDALYDIEKNFEIFQKQIWELEI
jgi:DNA polymerase III epsilon subunit-like protein